MTDQQSDNRTAARRAGDTETWDEKVLTALMTTPQGRYWMERLLEFCNVGGSAYHWDGDTAAAMKRDGMADVGRYLERELQTYCPDLYVRMIRERRGRAERQMDKQAREQSRQDGPRHFASGYTVVDDLEALQRAEEAKQKPNA
jgi:hypothetical protein